MKGKTKSVLHGKNVSNNRGVTFFPEKHVYVYFPMNRDGSRTLHCAHFHIVHSQI